MGNRVEVNVKMDDRHTVRFEVRGEDVYEIMKKYAVPQNKESQEINVLDFLNYRQN